MQTAEQISNLEAVLEPAATDLSAVPRLVESVRVRKREPFAYNSATFQVLEFNEDAMAIVRLVDGERSVSDIARALAATGVSDPDLGEQCYTLLSSCVSHGAMEWRGGAAQR
jgi:hypothetical protein